jgi:hypothetical protein
MLTKQHYVNGRGSRIEMAYKYANKNAFRMLKKIPREVD